MAKARRRRARWLIGDLVAVMLVALAVPAPTQTAPVKMEWLSWSIFRFTSPTGKVIVTNPFVTNPDSPVKVADVPKADVIVVADGHRDEVGSTDEIAIKTGAKIVTPFEMWTTYFEPRKVPEAQLHRSNPGDWLRLDGLTIRNVNAVHGSGTPDKLYGGPAMGFIKSATPTGGVNMPVATAMIITIPKWTGSIPIATSAGTRMGGSTSLGRRRRLRGDSGTARRSPAGWAGLRGPPGWP